MNRIDLLAFKTDSYDTEGFIEDAISYSSNSIILIFDKEKIKVGYKSPSVELKKDVFKFPEYKVYKLNIVNLFFKSLEFFLYMLVSMKVLSSICWKYRPKICYIENTWAAVIVGFLRKFYLCDKSIYVPGDWLASKSNKKFVSYIGNNLLFPIFDYLACRLNDLVLNHTEQIAEARYKFWGRKIAKREKLYLYKMRVKASNEDNKNIDKKNICFIGNIRKDSGLEIVIKSLPKLREEKDISLKILGPKSYLSEYLRNLSIQYNVSRYVEIFGFVETDRFVEILSDCFCGINLLTSTESYSSYTIPGKIIHYLQHLLPVIVTEGSGVFVTSIIRNNKLGLVIKPSQEAFANAINEIYENQKKYRKNIVEYINKLPQVNIKELFEA